ncbi:splicing factor 3B subunit 1-like [Dorcoceras hygrometricum]|uniref:Splicing factor 3B subunit 1-like n=1 Tax=Dorcoceras hygrometricum TaxID=472368 RepID=A0A2Z7BT07_9LAMI|nr:splicing factor 3B subunit 1-like [Dorcoceras hygrometricum]
MASSLIANALQVNFDSVLGIPDNEGMVTMFRALVSTGLSGFLGLEQFLDTASVKVNEIICAIQGKFVGISEDLFAGVFELPTTGLTDVDDVPKDLVYDARSILSKSGEQVQTSCKKRKMKNEFRLLNDILAKSVTVKAGSFDAVTHERFLLMTAIHFRLKINWSKILFDILKGMVTKTSKQAKGFAAQICALLKSAPNLTMGEAKTFPPLKILTAKTVGTYIAKQKGIDDSHEEDEPVVKKKVVSMKRPAVPSVETAVKKRRTTVGRAAPAATDLALVTLAQGAVPLQMISAMTPPAPKCKASKRKLQLPVGSDDEIVETEPDVENVVEKQREQTTADDVDKIIDQVISKKEQMETDMEEPSSTRSDDIVVEITERSTAVNDEDDNIDGAENEIARKMASFTAPKQLLKESLRSGEDDDMSGLKQPSKIIEMEKEKESEKNKEIEPVATDDLSLGKSVATMTDSEDTVPLSKVLELTDKSKSDEESMSIEDILKQIPADMMLPSMTAAEVTRIKFGLSIEISEVNEGDWYKAIVPRIAASAKGKAPLAIVPRIAASAKGKAPLVAKDEIKGHPAREMFSLICADIDFLVQLREKPIDKYFEAGQPTSAIDLQIIALLSNAHLFAFKTLQTQMRIHGLKWERICSSRLFEGVHKDRDAVISRSNTNNRSLCWIRTKTMVDGSWLIQEGNDFWKRLPKPVLSLEWQIPAQRQFDDTLAPISEFFKIFRKHWADVCIEVVQFPAFSLLQPVGSHNFCRDIVAVSSVVDLAVDPTDFVGIFRRGLDVQVITSDSSSSYISSQPDPISPNYSLSQIHLDTSLTSPNPSISTDSRVFFTTDDITLGVGTAVDQILMPATAVTSQDFREPLAQLRASVNQIQIERVQKRDDAQNLKDMLLLHIRSLEQRFTEILEQQDRTYRGLFAHVRQEVQLQKAALSLEVLDSRQKLKTQQVAWSQDMDSKLKGVQDQQATLSHSLMEFRVQAQENYNTLTYQFSELVDYINRGGDAKKGEGSSSRGQQPPPDDRSRPGSGDSSRGRDSRSEPARKRGGGGSHRRDWRYWIGGR